jgi:hypothetical protein
VVTAGVSGVGQMWEGTALHTLIRTKIRSKRKKKNERKIRKTTEEANLKRRTEKVQTGSGIVTEHWYY